MKAHDDFGIRDAVSVLMQQIAHFPSLSHASISLIRMIWNYRANRAAEQGSVVWNLKSEEKPAQHPF